MLAPEQDKAASSKNAVTHGIFTATFAALRRPPRTPPQGFNEELVFANLIQAA
ncbi:MAG: hypothetical protein U0Q16_22310 [Bryobacteraceae bacterium]